MTPTSHQHLLDLLSALAEEVRERKVPGRARQDVLTRIETVIEAPPSDFGDLLDTYVELTEAKANAFHAAAEIAASYGSMEEFWADAADQEAGRSDRGYWDSYEHGRRRQLETRLADAYGAAGAVLLNTGMSALVAAVGACGLRPGDRIVTHGRSYFETSEYLAEVVAPTGVAIDRVDLGSKEAAVRALGRPGVRVLLVETALNCPPADVPVSLRSLVPEGVQLIVDNSVLSHGVRWSELGMERTPIVVESATKYLTRSCAAGVVYGEGEVLDRARAYARRTGQQLQERAFNHLHLGELELAGDRVRIHSTRSATFRSALDPDRWEWIHSPGDQLGDRDDELAEALRHSGSGALVFLKMPGPVEQAAQRHRHILERWRAGARQEGFRLDVRAGFGWNRTTARAYESSALNQPDAPAYMRVSVGIEPEDHVRRLGELLDESAARAR